MFWIFWKYFPRLKAQARKTNGLQTLFWSLNITSLLFLQGRYLCICCLVYNTSGLLGGTTIWCAVYFSERERECFIKCKDSSRRNDIMASLLINMTIYIKIFCLSFSPVWSVNIFYVFILSGTGKFSFLNYPPLNLIAK